MKRFTAVQDVASFLGVVLVVVLERCRHDEACLRGGAQIRTGDQSSGHSPLVLAMISSATDLGTSA